jgi:FKBP-type peptidyl-prolyl cis-trans isomerase
MSGSNKSKSVAKSTIAVTKGEPLAVLDEHSQKIIDVRIVMKERDNVRKENDFNRSDVLRDKLKSQFGVEVLDQKNGPSGWRFIDGSTNKLPAGTKAIPEEARKKRPRTDEELENNKSNDKNKSKKSEIKKSEKKNEKPSKLQAEQERNKAALSKVTGVAPGTSNVSGVIIEELITGTGKKVESGNKIKVHYIGKLKSNNKVFDSSTQKPFQFRFGRSEVIRGWDIGISGMCVGGKRRLTIPPEKAYGKAGAPPTIPSNATLIFEVTLLGV